jgi:3-phosphoshikimate 1-carboxyvinyltransferase
MIKRISPCPTLSGEIIPLGDKSISHRAIILNSIACGKATVGNFSPGADCLSTVSCLQALGVEIKRISSSPLTFEVQGVGGQGLHEAEDVLNAGNSATTMRLLAGLLAAQPFLSIITGDSSLRSRPMGRLIHPLRSMGASIWGRGGDSLAPLVVRGGELHGITYCLPVPSAQLKSALMIAALFASGETEIIEPAPSRDHTERLLQAMGAKLEKSGRSITIIPQNIPLSPTNVYIPGDISSIAYWLVAGAIHPDARIKMWDVGINPTRTGIIDVLLQMGARLKVENQRWEGGEPIADISIESSELVSTNIGGELIPRLIDEIPLVALAACRAKGTTVIRDAAELRVKEVDRISTTLKELSKMGAKIEELPDGMLIHGGRQLEGAACSSHKDHRQAMVLGIAGLIAKGETIIHDAEAADFSYPNFWHDMDKLRQNPWSPS